MVDKARQMIASGITKLHLGCGNKILEGYINIDLHRPEADLQLDITDLSVFEDNSIDEIFMNAVFEHLHTFEQKISLAEWHRVLKPNGVLRIDSVPDFDEVIRAYSTQANGNTRRIFDLDEVSRYTHGAYSKSDHAGQMHKDIFTKSKLTKLIEESGFVVDSLESVCWQNEPQPVNLNLAAHKVASRVSRLRSPYRFGAVYCIYDDYTWLQESFHSIYEACSSIYFLVSDRPWNGIVSDNSKTLACIKNLPDSEHKVRLVKGIWSNETDQRNAGLAMLKESGLDYCFVVDADEIYEPDQLKRMMLFASHRPSIACWHMTWNTYWKSHEYIIEPREQFKPAVFVKVGSACFIHYRDVEGENHGFIPPHIGFCHHMSYARSEEEIYKKITTFSHAHEIRNDWFENIWKRWDSDHGLVNIHPTHPPAYQRAVRMPFESLPSVLRKWVFSKHIILPDRIPGLVSIVILTCNQLKYTKLCVESIQRCTPEPHEIIFVDNDSTDGTVDWLNQFIRQNPNCQLVRNNKNLGFSRGCNQGIRVAKGEYILLLNNDVIVTEHWLSGMLECLKSASDTGIIGPMTNNISGVQKVEQANYSSLDELAAHAKEFRARNRHRRIPFRRIVGFCALFRRALVETIGLLDESFGSGNYEDDDYCLRAALFGYRNLICGDVFIHHYGSMTFLGNRIEFGSALKENIFKNKWGNVDSRSILGKKLVAIRAMEQAHEFKHQGQFDKAMQTLRETLNFIPEDRDIYYSLVEILVEIKKYDEALKVLNAMPGDSNTDIQALLLTGYCKEGLGLLTEAAEEAEHILRLDESNASALNLKGVLAYKQENHAMAREFFQQAMKADPGYGEPYANLGVLEWTTGQHQKALELLERGFILAPTLIDIVTSYHSSMTQNKQFSRAESIFREAKAFYPHNKSLIFLLIDLMLRQQKFPSAMHEMEQALVLCGIEEEILRIVLHLRAKMGPHKMDGTANRNTLCLCMVVKNEEQNMARSLLDMKSIVQEIIVVDRHSDDRTKDIATAFGAKVYDAPAVANLAEIRNFSLAKATCDWILVLDADEFISPLDYQSLSDLIARQDLKRTAFAFTIRNYLASAHLPGWTANSGKYVNEETGTGWVPSNKIRLFPRDERIRFSSSEPETSEIPLNQLEIDIQRCEIPIHHYGKWDIGQSSG